MQQRQDSPFNGFKVARGTIHVHSINSNQAVSIPKGKIKDPDHLFAEDYEATHKRASKLGLNFLFYQDHGEKMSLGAWYRLGNLERDKKRLGVSGLNWIARGFEWTQGSLVDLKSIPGKARKGLINHVGVFGTEDFTGTSVGQTTGMQTTPDLHSLYRWILAHQSGKMFCSFNHPGYGDNHFNDFEISAGVERLVDYFRLIEVGSGSSIFYEGIAELEKHYIKALQKGWRVMPAIGVDNPGKLTHPYARKRHTAYWLREIPLSVGDIESLFKSVNSCFGYASEDADVVVEFWLSGVHNSIDYDSYSDYGDRRELGLMGKAGLYYCQVYPTTVHWQIYEEGKGEGWKEIKLVRVAKDRTVEQLLGRTLGTLELNPDSNDLCYYLKGVQLDGDRFISAPLWMIHRKKVAEGSGFDPWLGAIRWQMHSVAVDTKNGLPVLLPIQPQLRLTFARFNIPDDRELKVEWERPTRTGETYPAASGNPIEKSSVTIFPGDNKDNCRGRFPHLDDGIGAPPIDMTTDTLYQATLLAQPRFFANREKIVLTIRFYVRPNPKP